jgi:ribonuclease HII
MEKRIWANGKTPAGVDEAGRGPLAGPVVAAAVILPESFTIVGLDDSKKLTHLQRVKILDLIITYAVDLAVGIVDHEAIDGINILRASLRAMEIAVNNLVRKPDFLLIDGNQRTSLLIPQETVIKGDSRCCSIAAAIVAKVRRDEIMDEYLALLDIISGRIRLSYEEHLEAIRNTAPALHRRNFGVLDPNKISGKSVSTIVRRLDGFNYFLGDVPVHAVVARLDSGDLIDHVHAVDYLTEYGVPVIPHTVVEEAVVGEIDEELRRGAVHDLSPRHRERAPFVLEPVLGLVLDRGFHGLLIEVGGKPAALNHEIRYNTMKYCPVVKTVIDV